MLSKMKLKNIRMEENKSGKIVQLLIEVIEKN